MKLWLTKSKLNEIMTDKIQNEINYDWQDQKFM